MAKSKVSAAFQKVASRTTKGAFDEARKAERQARGIPFPIGMKGTGVVSCIVCDMTKAKEGKESVPIVRVELKADTPEGARGKILSGPGLMWMIKASATNEDWGAEDAWGMMLGGLEQLGCPEELTKNYDDFQEVVDWFEEEPRKVSWEVVDASYTNNKGKVVSQKAFEVYEYVNVSQQETAEGTSEEIDPNAKYVLYKGKKHRVVEENEDDNTYVLVSVASGVKRTVSQEDCEDC